jgi:hypothetical protein
MILSASLPTTAGVSAPATGHPLWGRHLFIPPLGAETFARASAATFGSLNGGDIVIATAASGTKRTQHYVYDSNGVLRGPTHLLEMARTNLLLRSGELDHAAWTGSRAVAVPNAGLGPDGVAQAFKIRENTETGSHRLFQSLSKSGVATVYTLSCFLKASDYNTVVLRLSGAGETQSGDGIFNLQTGVATASASGFTAVSARMEEIASGWYWCAVTATSDTTTTIAAHLRLRQNDGTVSWAGDNTSGVLAWGAQLEAANFASAYIPTTSAAVTRVADACSYAIPAAMEPAAIAAAGGAAWYCEFVEGGTIALNISARLWHLGASTGARILVYATGAPGKYRAQITDGTTTNTTSAAVSTPEFGDRVQVLVMLAHDGSVTFRQRVNAGAVESMSTVPLSLPATWSNNNLYILGTSTGTSGRNAFIPNTRGQEVTFIPGLPALGLTAEAAMDFAAARHIG